MAPAFSLDRAASINNMEPHIDSLHRSSTPSGLSQGLQVFSKYGCSKLALFRRHQHFFLLNGEVLVLDLQTGVIKASVKPTSYPGLVASHFVFVNGKWRASQAMSPESGNYRSLLEAQKQLTPSLMSELSTWLVAQGLDKTVGVCFAYASDLPGNAFQEDTDEAARKQYISPISVPDIMPGGIETYWAGKEVGNCTHVCTHVGNGGDDNRRKAISKVGNCTHVCTHVGNGGDDNRRKAISKVGNCTHVCTHVGNGGDDNRRKAISKVGNCTHVCTHVGNGGNDNRRKAISKVGNCVHVCYHKSDGGDDNRRKATSKFLEGSGHGGAHEPQECHTIPSSHVDSGMHGSG